MGNYISFIDASDEQILRSVVKPDYSDGDVLITEAVIASPEFLSRARGLLNRKLTKMQRACLSALVMQNAGYYNG